MGADYLTASCYDIGPHTTPQQVHSAINNGSIDPALTTMASHTDWLIDDIADQSGIDITTPAGTLTAARLVAARAATEIWWTQRRDIDTYDGTITTGGPSYGEAPTDAYDHIAVLAYIDEPLIHALNLTHPNPKERALRLVYRIHQGANNPTQALTLADIEHQATLIITHR